MSLEELINEFLSEEYKFFKYRDKDGNQIMLSMEFGSHREFFMQYMKYYKEQPSINDLLNDAALGIIKIEQADDKVYYIRHPHQEVFTDRYGNQRGISKEIAEQVRNNLILRSKDLLDCSDFAQILQIVEQCRVRGFGELSIYDTAVRIGAYLGVEPDRIYLHAGTREGISILELKGYLPEGTSKRKSIGMDEMPEEFQKLAADEAQHFACSKKEDMKSYLDVRADLFS